MKKIISSLCALAASAIALAGSALAASDAPNVNTGSKSYVVIIFIIVLAALAGIVVYNIIKMKKQK